MYLFLNKKCLVCSINGNQNSKTCPWQDLVNFYRKTIKHNKLGPGQEGSTTGDENHPENDWFSSTEHQ